MNSRQQTAVRHEVRKELKELGILPLLSRLNGSSEIRQDPPENIDHTEVLLVPEKVQSDNPAETTTRQKTEWIPKTRMWISRALVWLYRAFVAYPYALVAIGSTLLVYYPKFTSTVASPLTPTDPLSAPFEITYDGPIPLGDVRLICILEDVETVDNWRIRDLAMEETGASVSTMYWGDSQTVQCKSVFKNLSLDVNGKPNRIKSATISVVVEYAMVGLPWRRSLVIALVKIAHAWLNKSSLQRLPNAIVWDNLCSIYCGAELRIRTQVGRDLLGVHFINSIRIGLQRRTCRFKLRLHLVPSKSLLSRTIGSQQKPCSRNRPCCRNWDNPSEESPFHTNSPRRARHDDDKQRNGSLRKEDLKWSDDRGAGDCRWERGQAGR